MNMKRGFTLIELVITVGILALLSSMTLPSLRKYQRQMDAKVAAQELRTSILQAQSYALAPRVSYTGKTPISNYVLYLDRSVLPHTYKIMENYGVVDAGGASLQAEVPGTKHILPENLSFDSFGWVNPASSQAAIVFSTAGSVGRGKIDYVASKWTTDANAVITIENSIDSSANWQVTINKITGVLDVSQL